MRTHRDFAALVLILLVSHVTAWSAITYDLVDRGVPTDGTTIASGFHGFTLRLTSDTGPITAVDFSGADGLFGPFVQRWSSDSGDGLYDVKSPGFFLQQNLTPSALNFDSHFLWPSNTSGTAITARAPDEDALIGAPGSQFFSFPPNNFNVGLGSGANLRSAYGITGVNQTSVMDVAYLVIPDGQDFSFTAQVATRNGTFPIASVVTTNLLTWNPPSNTWNSSAANQNWLDPNSTARPFSFGFNVKFTDAGLAGGGAVNVGAAGVHAGNVSVSNSSGTYTFTGGAIDAAGQLTKTGGGVVVINSPQSYAQNVKVGGGKLLVNSTLSSPNRIDVGSGGILGGNGTIASGATVGGGGILAPGDGIGTLTVHDLYLASGILQFDIGASANDRVVSTDTGSNGLFIDFNYPSTVQIADVGGAQPGSYVLIDYASLPLQDLRGLQLSSDTLGPYKMVLVNDVANTSIDLQISALSQWNIDANSDWSQPTSWSGSVVPEGLNAVARFGGVITLPRTVTLASSHTVNEVDFDSPVAYTLAGPGKLILDSSSGQTFINVARGSHSIAAPIQLNQDTTISVQSGTAALLISGPISSGVPAGTSSLTKRGPGTLKLTGANTYGGTTSIMEGTLIMDGTHSGGGTYTVRSPGTLSGSGSISAAVAVGVNAILAPGDGVGKLTVGGLSLNASLLNFDVSRNLVDQIAVLNPDSLSFGSNSTISLQIGSVTTGQFTLIDYAGAPLTNLNGLVLKKSTIPGLAFALVNNTANTSVDVQITPEPAHTLTAIVVMLLRSRWRGCRRRIRMT